VPDRGPRVIDAAEAGQPGPPAPIKVLVIGEVRLGKPAKPVERVCPSDHRRAGAAEPLTRDVERSIVPGAKPKSPPWPLALRYEPAFRTTSTAGPAGTASPSTTTVETSVPSGTGTKIEPEPDRPRYLVALRGLGYRFDAEGMTNP